MAKKKPDPEPVLKSWDEVDAALARVRTIEQDIAKKTADVNAKKKKLDEDLKAFSKDLLAEKKRLEKDLEEFSTKHKTELLPLKSRAFPHGKIMFNLARKTVTLPSETWESTLEKLKAKIADKLARFQAVCDKLYLRVKLEIDRERALADYQAKKITKARLFELGIVINEDDAFGYETADEEAKSVA